MTFQMNIVPNSKVQASSDVSLASTGVMALDSRDVEAFSGMMEQESKPNELSMSLAQTTGNNSVAYADDGSELPSLATLLSSSALTTSAQNLATLQSSTVMTEGAAENFMATHLGQVPQDIPAPQVGQISQVPQDIPAPQVGQISQVPQDISAPQVGQMSQVSQDILAPQVGYTAQVPQDILAPQVGYTAQVPQDISAPQVVQISQVPQDISAPQVGQISQVPQDIPAPQVGYTAQVPQDISAPQVVHTTLVPQDILAPQVGQMSQVPQDILAPQVVQMSQVPQDIPAPQVGQISQVAPDILAPIMSPDTPVQQGLSGTQADGALGNTLAATVSLESQVAHATQPSLALLEDDLVMQNAGALGVQQSIVPPVSPQATPSVESSQGSDASVYLHGSEPDGYTASLLASMNTLLQSSTMQNPTPMTVAETTAVGAPHFTAKEIDAMVTMLVDRVAVTDTTAHMVTVEVSLADTALRGTTVQLTRSLDGLLAVNVMTNDAASFQTLVGAQVDLRVKLEALDIGTVRVEISQMAQEQESNPQRRSATYQAYSGDDDDHA